MAELLTAAERASVAANLLDLHDTFGRDIVVYKEAQKSPLVVLFFLN